MTNGHVGVPVGGYGDAHGGQGYCDQKKKNEGERILEFALSHYLLVGNIQFIKDSHLMTFASGDFKCQVDYVI